MEIIFTDLNEKAPGLGEQLVSYGEAVPEIRKVGVNPELPRIPECANLFRLTGHVLRFPVGDVSLPRAHLPV